MSCLIRMGNKWPKSKIARIFMPRAMDRPMALGVGRGRASLHNFSSSSAGGFIYSIKCLV